MQESKMAQYEVDHIAKIRDIAPDCMVLLKSDGSFPLSKPGKIAAYGSGVRHTLKGGRGSGDVNPRHTVNVEEGLVNAGFEVTTKDWLDQYDKLLEYATRRFNDDVRNKYRSGEVDFMYIIGAAMPEMEYNIPMADSDTAIYVLSRNSGEGTDRLIEKGDFGDINDTCYKEGIYVGYRYFDSVGKKPLFPFGFGLSYTSFEAGDYVLRLGTSSRDTKPCAIVRMDERAVAGKHTHVGGEPGFGDWKPASTTKDALPQGVEVIKTGVRGLSSYLQDHLPPSKSKASSIKPYKAELPRA